MPITYGTAPTAENASHPILHTNIAWVLLGLPARNKNLNDIPSTNDKTLGSKKAANVSIPSVSSLFRNRTRIGIRRTKLNKIRSNPRKCNTTYIV
jgi:hypothetical protein